ncbi:hypothetical protein GT412_13220, partial [Enterococcus durans]|nr:hypothetical protein [Enterococcus durans]MZI10014.1 hypothetical protein [Enterococcus durans]MZI12719.1 hypothetical protein [Enterococcus durans]MZI19929.1 hypothetical protein [Enterococcus durans]MZI36056.1 hypothetical protein [Enterococcus durans]
MPFIAILLDLLAAGAYFLQLNHQTETFLLIGLIFQGIVTLILCFMTWNGNSFFDKFYKVQNFFPYAIPIVLDNEPP